MATALSSLSAREHGISLATVPAESPSHTMPASGMEPAPHPRRLLHQILLLEPSPLLGSEHLRAFRAAGYALRPVRAWHHALDYVEQGEMDVVLLDLDMIDAAVSRLNISADRLITLLHRSMSQHPIPIAAISGRDYSEIAHTLATGVDVFVARDNSLYCLIHRIDAARNRLSHRQAV